MARAAEDRLTSWLRRRVGRHGPDLIGDDAAFLPDGTTAVTVDQQIERVHFPEGLSPAVVGRRLVQVNLSDIAAVGGLPTFGFLTVAAQPAFPVRMLLAAVEEELAKHRATLAGGDLASGEHLATSLTLLGMRRPGTRWLRRDTARPGDRLWVGGTVGDSALGRHLLAAGARFEAGHPKLTRRQEVSRRTPAAARRAIRRHLRPKAQLELGQWLATQRRAAAIDISDGLLLDLGRLCSASDVGARIDAKLLPVVSGFPHCAESNDLDPMQLALSGGEDYVLIFALPSGAEPPDDLDATSIGVIEEGSGVEIDGAAFPDRTGWDHFARHS